MCKRRRGKEYNFTKCTMEILVFNPFNHPLRITAKPGVYPDQNCTVKRTAEWCAHITPHMYGILRQRGIWHSGTRFWRMAVLSPQTRQTEGWGLNCRSSPSEVCVLLFGACFWSSISNWMKRLKNVKTDLLKLIWIVWFDRADVTSKVNLRRPRFFIFYFRHI